MAAKVAKKPAKKTAKKPAKKAGAKPALGKNGKPKKKKKAKDPNKPKYDAKAAADKKRYEKEMKAYKPPYKPKRAMVAFMFFSIEQRPAVQKANKSMGIAEISKVLGAKWRGMSDSDKVPYENKAKIDKQRYEKEMKTFK